MIECYRILQLSIAARGDLAKFHWEKRKRRCGGSVRGKRKCSGKTDTAEGVIRSSAVVTGKCKY